MKTSDIKHYVVSFGSSNTYRLDCPESAHLAPVVEAERELNDYLKKEYSNETFTYYTEPKVIEISDALVERIKDYRPFDRTAIEEIKRELEREIATRDALTELDDNAPFNDAGPETKLSTVA